MPSDVTTRHTAVAVSRHTCVWLLLAFGCCFAFQREGFGPNHLGNGHVRFRQRPDPAARCFGANDTDLAWNGHISLASKFGRALRCMAEVTSDSVLEMSHTNSPPKSDHSFHR